MRNTHKPLISALAELEKLNLPVMQGLQPGLTDKEIDAMTRQFPYPLSPEIRTLYRWHNGYADGVHLSRRLFNRGFFCPLADLIPFYLEAVRFTEEEDIIEMGGEQPEPDLSNPLSFSTHVLQFWYPNYFPILPESLRYLLFVVLGKEIDQPGCIANPGGADQGDSHGQ